MRHFTSLVFRQTGCAWGLSRAPQQAFCSSFESRIAKYAKSTTIKKSEQDLASKYAKEGIGSADSIVKRRRIQSKYFELQESKKKDLDIFIEAYTDTVIEFQLYMDYFSHECQEIEAIMNYYEIAFKKVTGVGHRNSDGTH